MALLRQHCAGPVMGLAVHPNVSIICVLPGCIQVSDCMCLQYCVTRLEVGFASDLGSTACAVLSPADAFVCCMRDHWAKEFAVHASLHTYLLSTIVQRHSVGLAVAFVLCG